MSRLINRPLLDAAGGDNGLLTGLVSYWELDEVSGASQDSHGTNHETASLGKTSGVTGKISSSVDLTGNTSYIRVGNSLSLDPTSGLTISAWLNADVVTNIMTIFSRQKNIPPYYPTYDLRFSNSGGGKIELAVTVGSSSKVISGTTVVPTGVWNHVVVTFDETDMRVYLNGASDATPLATGGPMTAADTITTIGNNPITGNRGFNGRLDEIGFWNRALTAAQVTALYNAGAGLAYGSFTS